MMQQLPQVLFSLGFAAEDFEVHDDLNGTGPYIKIWNSTIPQPSVEEINAEWASMQIAETTNALANAQLRAKNEIDRAAAETRARGIRYRLGLPHRKVMGTAPTAESMGVVGTHPEPVAPIGQLVT